MSTMMSVSSLNTKIKSLLEATFMHTMVDGEVASCTYHTSGHLYFSIKDEKSSIKCVMWRSSVSKMKFRIEKGMHIVVEGSVSVYTPRGEYQFQTVRIEPYGQGALALAYEQLKEKLKSQGYFESIRKKKIPKKIQKIVLVTAKNSAALHDMLKIIQKRWPLLEVIILDTLVQGENASSQIVNSLKYADSLNADVIVCGRGGGSAEDLWSFNEENVADMIFKMNTPVVSAVGHEVDIMISDFVADLRAPTPSAAIEMILADKNEMIYYINELEEKYTLLINQKMLNLTNALKYKEEILRRSSPSRKLFEMKKKFKCIKVDFKRIMMYKIEQLTQKIPKENSQYKQAFSFLLEQKMQYLNYLEKTITINNPRNQCRTGWSKVSIHGKTIALSSLKINQKFLLEDEFSKVEALCVSNL